MGRGSGDLTTVCVGRPKLEAEDLSEFLEFGELLTASCSCDGWSSALHGRASDQAYLGLTSELDFWICF